MKKKRIPILNGKGGGLQPIDTAREINEAPLEQENQGTEGHEGIVVKTESEDEKVEV